MLSWVQGMRPLDDASMSWMEVLYLRLSGQLARIVTGPKTAASEKLLDIGTNSYYYIAHAHPEYGDLVVAHDESDVQQGVLLSATPFDTGGLAQKRIATVDLLSDNDRKTLVQRWTFKASDYEPAMREWVDEAYDAPTDYVTGLKQPANLLVKEIDLSKCSSHAWTWEGRLPADVYGGAPIRVAKIYMKPRRTSIYFEWVRTQKMLSAEEAREHMRVVTLLTEEVSAPVASMRSYMIRGGAL